VDVVRVYCPLACSIRALAELVNTNQNRGAALYVSHYLLVVLITHLRPHLSKSICNCGVCKACRYFRMLIISASVFSSLLSLVETSSVSFLLQQPYNRATILTNRTAHIDTTTVTSSHVRAIPTLTRITDPACSPTRRGLRVM